MPGMRGQYTPEYPNVLLAMCELVLTVTENAVISVN
jgi:hypothetical protein